MRHFTMAFLDSTKFLIALLCFFLAHSLSNAGSDGLDMHIPTVLQRLASPLSLPFSRVLVQSLKNGTKASFSHQFCTAAKLYCSEDLYGSPRVCIPFYHYEYGVLPCELSLKDSSRSQASLLFFKAESLRTGSITLPDLTNTLHGSHFLPQELADVLPFGEDKLLDLQKLMNISSGSDMQQSMKQTLNSCASPPIAGEKKKCFSSIESMVKYARQNVGSHMQLLTPVETSAQKQQSKVLSVVPVNGRSEKVIACHNMVFPWLVYSCHMTNTVQILDVALMGKNDGKAFHELAVCHLDTKSWNPKHVSFRMLHLKPGEGEICHWVPQNTFLWTSRP